MMKPMSIISTTNKEEDESTERTPISQKKIYRRAPDPFLTKGALALTTITVLMLLLLSLLFRETSEENVHRFLEDDNDDDCEDIFKKTSNEQCNYAKTCNLGNGVSFFPSIFCLEWGVTAWTILLSGVFIVLLLLLFRMLGSTAEDFFSPGLEMFSCKMGLPPRFAGVSLLAFGNGAADVSATMNAVTGNPTKGYMMSLGALTGAGMFVTCIVSGMVILVAEGINCRGALVRDVIMYTMSLGLVFFQLHQGYIDQSAIYRFIMMYVAFVLIVLIADIYHRKVVLPRIAAGLSETEEDVRRTPIPMKAVKSTLLALSNYSTIDLSNADEKAQMLHGKMGILNRNDNEEGEEPLQNHYEAMIDNVCHVEQFQISSWCVPENALNHGALNWHHAFLSCKLELKEHMLEYWYDVFDNPNVQLYEKLLFILEIVPLVLRKTTIPVPTDGFYCRGLVALALVCSPVWFGIYLLQFKGINSFDLIGIPWFWIHEGIAILCALCVIRWAPGGEGPMSLFFACPIALYGFIIAATWIDAIANVLVSFLEFLGLVCHIPSSVMGLTVLAWGNSMSDLSANVAMARKGLANMAITACYAGPVFNILIGLAAGFSSLHAAMGTTSTNIKSSFEIDLGFLFLILQCLLLIIFGLVFGSFYVHKSYGYVALLLYAIYVISSVTVSFHKS